MVRLASGESTPLRRAAIAVEPRVAFPGDELHVSFGLGSDLGAAVKDALSKAWIEPESGMGRKEHLMLRFAHVASARLLRRDDPPL